MSHCAPANSRFRPVVLTGLGVRTPNNARLAFTLVEVMVVVAIIAVVIGLTLPAVQRARAAMQRTECINNLRQLGLATFAYEQTHGVIPRSSCVGTQRRLVCFSAHARLLPWLEGDNIATGIDWLDEIIDERGQPARTGARNKALLRQTVPVFLCPADDNARGGANSYRQSRGNRFGLLGNGHDPLPGGWSAVGDGLSHTALFSERLVGGGPPVQRNPLLVDCEADNGPCCVQAQLNVNANFPDDPFAGTTWLVGADRHTAYLHLFPPNSRMRDCETWLIGTGIITARSAHPGGVNLLFADGHGQFVSNDVELTVWRAWGTPNGRETSH